MRITYLDQEGLPGCTTETVVDGDRLLIRVHGLKEDYYEDYDLSNLSAGQAVRGVQLLPGARFGFLLSGERDEEGVRAVVIRWPEPPSG